MSPPTTFTVQPEADLSSLDSKSLSSMRSSFIFKGDKKRLESRTRVTERATSII